VVLAGGPRAGKTTLAEALGTDPDRTVRGSDALAELEWSESSLVASKWFDEPGPWLFEGVVMPRALRKWLARNPDGRPADLIVWINDPVVERNRGQHVMALGCNTVWREIRPELVRRGQEILEA
jgi:hypothetical protein